MPTTAPRKLQEWASETDSQARIDEIKTKEQLRAQAYLQMQKMEILTNDDAENIYSAEYKRREKIFDGLLRLVSHDWHPGKLQYLDVLSSSKF